MKKNPVIQSYKLEKNPVLFSCLNINTDHITERDNELLKEACKGESVNPIVAYKYTYGYFVHVWDLSDDVIKAAHKHGFSKNLTHILSRAHDLKCNFICFDCDGITYDDLPNFDW